MAESKPTPLTIRVRLTQREGLRVEAKQERHSVVTMT
jgi:hypothetical protein